MRSMTVKEARDAFDRDGKGKAGVAAVVSSEEYERFRQWRVEGLMKAMDKIVAEAAAKPHERARCARSGRR
jgi:hypothetical protein